MRQIPALYAQDGKGEEAIAYAKYFAGGWTWYATEMDPDEFLCFGKTYSPMEPDGELGYFSLEEIAPVRVGFGFVERDTSFKPTALKNCHNPCVARR